MMAIGKVTHIKGEFTEVVGDKRRCIS
jgi:hypothetical protein